MHAREFDCKVTELIWLTPSVFSLRFEPSRKFSFEPGQFLSIRVPSLKGLEAVRRIYSFASTGRGDGYELCVQLQAQGRGSTYLASLRPGEHFRASAPYGDFMLKTSPGRNVCFVATGTGIAPFKSMVLSRAFQKNPPVAALLLFGARSERDILYPGLFEKQEVEVVHALSRPSPQWSGSKGRVTDFLQSLPPNWPWLETDFYLCGNPAMVEEVRQLLLRARHVPEAAIRQEAYFSADRILAPDQLREAA